jgi:hypothetical protein
VKKLLLLFAQLVSADPVADGQEPAAVDEPATEEPLVDSIDDPGDAP